MAGETQAGDTQAADTQLAVVIVTRNRCSSLQRTLLELRSLEAPFPIVVVDNNSDDRTREMVRQFGPAVRLISLGENLGAVARDLGVRAVQQPYVAFADDDSWWAPGSLSRAVELFAQHLHLGLLMSRILVGAEERLDAMCDLMSRTPLPCDPQVPGYPILGFVACGAIVRRSAYLAAGGFHPRFDTGGEEELVALTMAQHSWALQYLPEVVSHHYASDKRNMDVRSVLGERNRLWTVWLRRRLRPALRLTSRAARAALAPQASPVERRGFLLALNGLPWVLRQRRPISPALEARVALLERQREQQAL